MFSSRYNWSHTYNCWSIQIWKIRCITSSNTFPINRFQAPGAQQRYDGLGHVAVFDEATKFAMTCKYKGCSARVYTMCVKCNAHLCIRRGANHFQAYHKKWPCFSSFFNFFFQKSCSWSLFFFIFSHFLNKNIFFLHKTNYFIHQNTKTKHIHSY